jgi:hypothetical protein
MAYGLGLTVDDECDSTEEWDGAAGTNGPTPASSSGVADGGVGAAAVALRRGLCAPKCEA